MKSLCVPRIIFVVLTLCLLRFTTGSLVKKQVCTSTFSDSGEYNEELFIHDVGNGNLFLNFNFDIFNKPTSKQANTEFLQTSALHFGLFPRPVAEIVSKYSVSEFHLSLSQGFWDYDSWGHPVQPVPLGAELWAWMADTENGDQNWANFVHTLSGMFCASLNFMSKPEYYTSPKWAFRPRGVSPVHHDSRRLRISQIMHQGVCTENETPWFKLLPCKKQAGIGQLLNSVKLHDAAYHAIQVHFVPTSDGHRLKLSFSTVLDRRILSYGSNNWSIFGFLKRAVSFDCALAISSKIYVQKSPTFSVQPNPTRELNLYNKSLTLLEFDLHKFFKTSRDSFSINFAYADSRIKYTAAKQSLVTVHKHQVGTGSELGGIIIRISNSHPTRDVTVGLLEVAPWYFRFLLHTLKISIRELRRPALKRLFEPSVDRSRPSRLELILVIPAKSVITVQYSFVKVLLRWNEFLPDANHGLYLPPTAVSFNCFTNESDLFANNGMPIFVQGADSLTELLNLKDAPDVAFMRVYSEPVLITVPKPDFSMPYNVLCLVCTVLAIGAGFLHNVTSKVLGVVDPTVPTVLNRIKEKIKALISRSSANTSNSTTSPSTSATGDEDTGAVPSEPNDRN